MTSTFGSLQTPLFIGKNYEYWSLTMKAEPTDMTAYNNLTQAEKDVLREQRKKDGKTLFFIHQAMHESILPRIAAKTNAKEAWDTLETAYQGLDKVKTSKLQILRRDFESLSMK